MHHSSSHTHHSMLCCIPKLWPSSWDTVSIKEQTVIFENINSTIKWWLACSSNTGNSKLYAKWHFMKIWAHHVAWWALSWTECQGAYPSRSWSVIGRNWVSFIPDFNCCQNYINLERRYRNYTNIKYYMLHYRHITFEEEVAKVVHDYPLKKLPSESVYQIT